MLSLLRFLCIFRFMKEEIGTRLKMARARQHMTLQEVAQKMGMDGKSGASRLSNYENGIREPDAATMLKIATALQEDPAILMFGNKATRGIGTEESEELTPGTSKLISAIIRADRRGDIDQEAGDTLWSVLSLYLRLKQEINNRHSDDILEHLKKT
jgi:transcriptional regulator with XRE-family HTH domain